MKSLRALMFGLIGACGVLLGATSAAQAQAEDPEPAKQDNVRIAVVELHRDIDSRAAGMAERAADRALEEKVDALLLDIETSGGQFDEMLRVSAAVDKVRAAGITTICLLKGHASEAGIIVALACDRVYMGPDSSMGSASIQGSVVFDDATRARALAHVRDVFPGRAAATGRSAGIAEAMLDPSIELIEILLDGRRRFASRGELEQLYASHGKDRVIQVGVVSPKGKLLTLTGEDAADIGIAAGTAASRMAVVADEFSQGAEEILISSTWADWIAIVVTNPIIRSLLFITGIVGLFLEIKSPGLSVPGLVGICCFGLFFFGHMAAGLAGASEVIIFLLGFILLLVEIFVIPGFGVAGVIGITLMIGALIFAQVPDVYTGGDWGGVNWSLLLSSAGQTSLSFILSLFAMAGAAWIFPRTPWGRKLTLEAPSVTMGTRGDAAPAAKLTQWVQKQGVAETDLRPAGRILIGETHLDVVTEGDFLERGTTVVVVGIVDNSLVVRGAGPA